MDGALAAKTAYERILLNKSLLFVELSCAGVERCCKSVECALQCDLLALRVNCCDVVKVLEHSAYEIIDLLLGNILVGDEDSHDCRCHYVLVDTLICLAGDLACNEEGILLVKLVKECLVKVEKVYILGGRKVHDSCCRVTGNNESGVDLVVLETACSGCEIKEVGLLEIFVGKARNSEDSLYVTLNA